MNPQFRIDLPARLAGSDPVILELGCGRRPQPGRICIDQLDMPHIDIVADLAQGLPFLPDNSVDEVHSRSFLEHVSPLEPLMREIWRVLKPGGRTHIFVPHFSNAYYYSDTSHRTAFGLYSFEYFSARQTRFKRKVPAFYHDFGFTTEEIRLVFDSPWRWRRLLRKAVGLLANLSPGCQEFYEENLCGWLSVYGLQAVLRAEKTPLR
jgi:predicted SAM-dependent methyltransferase